ncbi:hypothetical protein LTS08_003110 [Lithohypha guttulata]|uniref:uncharacterized protein n=1 Tax=Lithohypha guttulata TaxID=1690604 RepID=UPI002DDE29F7|nr:hypothetical protein LTR51_000234 [Lithohypha guttulata]KAK5103692.1 hypothetical protein LTS08_003110 [Lithohypha guttulata]
MTNIQVGAMASANNALINLSMELTNLDMDLTVLANAKAKGQALFATKFIKKGEPVMFLDPPVMMAIDSESLHRTCYSCLVTKSGMGRCGQCKMAYFCDKSCRNQAWKNYHKYECPILRDFKEVLTGSSIKDPPRNFRAVLRLILLHKAGKVSTSALQEVADLWHRANGRTDEHDNMLAQVIKGATETDASQSCILSLLRVMESNCYNIGTFSGDLIGAEVYLKISRANHSCAPNATFSHWGLVMWDRQSKYLTLFDKQMPAAMIVARQDIAKGEEITLAYVDIELELEARKHRLRYVYGFDCACPRCEKEEALCREKEQKLQKIASRT